MGCDLYSMKYSIHTFIHNTYIYIYIYIYIYGYIIIIHITLENATAFEERRSELVKAEMLNDFSGP